MRRLISIGLALMAGCTAPEEEVVEPTPWIYEDDPESQDLALNEAAVADAIEEALSAVLRIDPVPVISTFDAIMSEGDEDGCPFVYETVDNYAYVTFWQDACQASTGAAYEGYGYVYEYVDYPAGQDVVLDGTAILLSGEVHGADGSRLAGSGVVANIEGGGSYYDYFQRQLMGTFVIDGRQVQVDGLEWLDGSMQPDFSITSIFVPDLNPEVEPGLQARQVVVSGALSGLSEGAETVAFEDVNLTSEGASVCGDEPSGTISVRLDDGNWIDVVFDVGEDNSVPLDDPADCDGCGEAWYRGEAVGSVCIDFSGLHDWEERPW